MGAKQTKGQEPGGASPQHSWKRTPTKERGDILASLMLKSGDRLSRGGTPPPYQRRIGMIQEMMLMAKQGKQDEATEMLKTLRQVSAVCVCWRVSEALWGHRFTCFVSLFLPLFISLCVRMLVLPQLMSSVMLKQKPGSDRLTVDTLTKLIQRLTACITDELTSSLPV